MGLATTDIEMGDPHITIEDDNGLIFGESDHEEEDDSDLDDEDFVTRQANALVKIVSPLSTIETMTLRQIALQKKVTCLSIMMQSTNYWCNALQSLVGVFLHLSGAPETIQELLAHMGLLISMTSINKTIKHLSQEANKRIQETG